MWGVGGWGCDVLWNVANVLECGSGMSEARCRDRIALPNLKRPSHVDAILIHGRRQAPTSTCSPHACPYGTTPRGSQIARPSVSFFVFYHSLPPSPAAMTDVALPIIDLDVFLLQSPDSPAVIEECRKASLVSMAICLSPSIDFALR